jgi:hypothetical protein
LDGILIIGSQNDNCAFIYESSTTIFAHIVTLCNPHGQVTTDILNFGSSSIVMPLSNGRRTVAISAYLEPSVVKSSGALCILINRECIVYSIDIFDRAEETNGTVTYTQVQRIVPADTAQFNHFGEFLTAINEDTFIATAHRKTVGEFTECGSSYVFNRSGDVS